MTTTEFRALTAGQTKRGEKSARLRAKFAVVPARTPAEVADLPAQRALFDRHEKNDVCIRLGLPPSINAYWRTRVIPGKSFATTYTTPEAKAYIESVKAAWTHHWNGWPPDAMTGKLRLLILVHWPDARARDLDNVVKCLQDSLAKAGAMGDDCQVKHLSVREGVPSKPIGCVDVWLETIPE